MKAKKLLTTRDVARLLSTPDDPWSSRRARRWLLSTGAGVLIGTRVLTSRSQLLMRFEPAAHELRVDEEAAEQPTQASLASTQELAERVAKLERALARMTAQLRSQHRARKRASGEKRA